MILAQGGCSNKGECTGTGKEREVAQRDVAERSIRGQSGGTTKGWCSVFLKGWCSVFLKGWWRSSLRHFIIKCVYECLNVSLLEPFS